MSATFTMYKETEIEIDLDNFIEDVLWLYRLKRPLEKGSSFKGEIDVIIKDMTTYSPDGFDNATYIRRAIMKKAYAHAVEHHYPTEDFHMLKEIMDFI